MAPAHFVTPQANYVVVYEKHHNNPDLSWIDNEKFDALVIELPHKIDEALYASPDFPDSRKEYFVTQEYFPILRKLKDRGIPIAVPDMPVSTAEYESATKRYYANRRNKIFAWASPVALALAGLLGVKIRKTHYKKSAPVPVVEPVPKSTRREFLKKSAVIAGASTLAAAGITGSALSAKHFFLSPPELGLEGRSAVLAERCETDLAPLFARQSGKKPTILIHIGAAHSDIEAYLKDPKKREKMLLQLVPQFKNIRPPFARFQNEIFLFRFEPNAQLRREVISVPSILERLRARKLIGARFSRRDLFAAAAGRKNVSQKPLVRSRARRK